MELTITTHDTEPASLSIITALNLHTPKMRFNPRELRANRGNRRRFQMKSQRKRRAEGSSSPKSGGFCTQRNTELVVHAGEILPYCCLLQNINSSFHFEQGTRRKDGMGVKEAKPDECRNMCNTDLRLVQWNKNQYPKVET